MLRRWQAIYTPFNSGHFGLGYDAYTHFAARSGAIPDLLGAPGDQGCWAGAVRAGGEVTRSMRRGLCGSRWRLTPKPARRSKASPARPGGLGGCRRTAAPTSAASTGLARRQAWLKCKFMRDRLGEGIPADQRGDQLRPVRAARRAVCRGPGASSPNWVAVLPLRRVRCAEAHRRGYAAGVRIRGQPGRSWTGGVNFASRARSAGAAGASTPAGRA